MPFLFYYQFSSIGSNGAIGSIFPIGSVIELLSSEIGLTQKCPVRLCSIAEPIGNQSNDWSSIEFDWFFVRFCSIDHARNKKMTLEIPFFFSFIFFNLSLLKTRHGGKEITTNYKTWSCVLKPVFIRFKTQTSVLMRSCPASTLKRSKTRTFEKRCPEWRHLKKGAPSYWCGQWKRSLSKTRTSFTSHVHGKMMVVVFSHNVSALWAF